MKKTNLKSALRGHSSVYAAALFAVSAITTPAMAQDTAPAPAAPADEANEAAGEAIIVTGTRIARPDLASTVPISIIRGDEFIKQGNTNIGDTLNDFPQLRSSRGQQNPSTGVGIAGLNLLDLRGLGTIRTLVLVNGRRHVGADILNNAVSVDVNSIPANLIERVDIVTGGNSAVYGSDAIAGVVNFILRKDFDGLELNGKAGLSTPGSFGANFHIDGIVGKNFADGRGNVTLSLEYNRQNRVFASQVPWLRRVDGLIVTDLDGTGLAQNSDGVFDRTYQYDIRQANIHRFGIVPITYGTSTAACGIGISNGTTAGSPYNCTYLFNPDGSLVPQTGTRIGAGIIGTIIGGNGQTGREGDLYTLLPGQDIYNANLVGHYEFSPAADLFVEGKYSRIDSKGGNAGYGSIQGTFAQFDIRERIRLDNPFLTAGQRTLIANALTASGCNPSLQTACNVTGVGATTTRTTFPAVGGQGVSGPLNAADLAAITAGTYRFVIGRQFIDLGVRDENFRRQTYRGVVGMRGTFNDDWKYEVALNYGRFTEHTDATGYVDKQRFMLALDSGINPATGKIECRAKFDPAAAVAFPAGAANTARLAADIAACVPYNPFGAPDNSAAAQYVGVHYLNDSWMTQLDLSGFLAGDTSGFLNLPGGPVDFVIGGEYRKEDAKYQQDPFAAAGNTTAVAFGTFDPKAFKVKEAFAELRVPLIKNTPFFEELSLSGAARVSDYNGSAGTVWAWNVGGDWSPLSGLRFRANYSRAVRAPNLTETSSPLVANFAPGFADPCSGARINTGTQFRAANCAADLGPLLGNLAALGTSALPIFSGFNANLSAEKSNSLTIGAVVQPKAIRGLTLTVDYYNIKVNGVIVSLTAQSIANSCYDQPTLANPFCALFARNRTGNADSFGQGPGQILGNSLLSAPFNFASRTRRGIETTIDYRTNIFSDVKLNANLLYSHTMKNSNYENPSDPTFENRVLGEPGDPKDEVRLTLDLNKGAFTFGYQVHYIGPMFVNNYEDFNQLQDRPPQDADYSEIRRFPRVFYHDIRFEWDLEKSGLVNGLNFYAGIDNLLNRTPPLGSTGAGGTGGGGAAERPGSQLSNAAIYSVRGRQFYAGFRARF